MLNSIIEVLLSDEFECWLDGLEDTRSKIKVVARLRSMSAGNFGDAKAIGDDVVEMRMHFGPGYRLYYTRRDETAYLLLVGGSKKTRRRDIARAKAMAAEIRRAKR